MTFLRLVEPPRGPLRCDTCARFTSVAKGAKLAHEYGDYGSILSTEVLCPRCATCRYCKPGAPCVTHDRSPRTLAQNRILFGPAFGYTPTNEDRRLAAFPWDPATTGDCLQSQTERSHP